MNIELLRLVRLFGSVSRIQDLQTLTSMRLHLISYGKLGDTNLQLVKDMEQRHTLELQRFDNYFLDREKQAVDKYIEITNKEKEQNDNNDSSKQVKGKGK